VQSVNEFLLRIIQSRSGVLKDISLDADAEPAEKPGLSRIADMTLKTESFDHDPAWVGVNYRSATHRDPVTIRQDFGYSPVTASAGGRVPGEMGGFITPAGEAAFYGKPIDKVTLDQPLSASGTLNVGPGGTNILLGFFIRRPSKSGGHPTLWRSGSTGVEKSSSHMSDTAPRNSALAVTQRPFQRSPIPRPDAGT